MATQKYPLVELKGSAFTLPVIHLRTLDLDYIATELKDRLSQSVSFFAHAPVVLDMGKLRNTETTCDFRKLKALLRSVDLIAVGVHRCPETLHSDAVKAELAILKGGIGKNTSQNKTEENTKSPTLQNPPSKNKESRVRIIDKPVRSGQQIYAQNGDLIVLGPVNAGAEVIADGDIHIYAPLRGRALAGVMGDV
ncbi:MAG: septum site-determining protein MinC, partial [Desulfobulbaceae bacterium]|nr:septum site-determining protein MinC [Desulfobulbaceae bacterium]